MKAVRIMGISLLVSILCLTTGNAVAVTKVKVLDRTSFDGINDEGTIVERICINGYVYINMYQRKPVMTIWLGSHQSKTHYPVLQATIQSFVEGTVGAKPETCLSK